MQIDLIDKYYVGSFEIYSVRPSYSKIYIAASNDLNTAWTVIYNTDNLNFQDVGNLPGSDFMLGRTGRIQFTHNKGLFRYYRLIIDGTFQEASVQELLLYDVQPLLTTNNAFNTTSDDRLKHNEKYIKNALDTIMKLKPQIYDKTDYFKKEDYKGEVKKYKIESGFIAQEVNEIKELKHLVIKPSSKEKKQPYGLNYIGLIAYLTKSIQELNDKLSNLKNKIKNI